jgi:hypothetical protein
MVNASLRRSYSFFRGRTGCVGRDAAASLEYARAELWFKEREWDNDSDPDSDDDAEGSLRFVWEEDEGYSPGDYDSPDLPLDGWVCMLDRWNGRSWRPLESLCGITFAPCGEDRVSAGPWGNPYKRQIEAELALEAMQRD